MAKLTAYEKSVLLRIRTYERRLYQPSGLAGIGKGLQQKLDGIIPKKIHQTMAKALEKGTMGFLQGLTILPQEKLKQQKVEEEHLDALTEEARRVVSIYKRLATVEGAGTGFGGLVSSAIDFPLLLSIKYKMLQELLLIFGYRIENFEERLFALKLFQLQFSGQKVRQVLWQEVKQWETNKELNEWESWENFDWEAYYMEYKQSIELRKLLQVVPGFGAIVGAWANFKFLEELGETVILALQLRFLQKQFTVEELGL